MPFDIKDSIERTWTYIVPSMFETSILVFVTLFILGTSGIRNWLETNVTKTSVLMNPEVIKFLETYGITKIMPLAVVFILLMFCFSISRISHSVGNLIPVGYVHNAGITLLESKNRWVLTTVLQYYPSFTDANDLNFIMSLSTVLDEKVDRAEIEGKSSFYSSAVGARKVYRKQSRRFAFLKFMFLWLIVVLIAAFIYGNPIRVAFWRIGLISLALLIAAYVLLKNQSKYSAIYLMSKIYALKAELESQYTMTRAPDLSKRGEIVQSIDKMLEKHSESLRGSSFNQPTALIVGHVIVYPWANFGMSLSGKPTVLARFTRRSKINAVA